MCIRDRAQTDLPLLYREARGVRLSPPGQAFLHHARLMLRQVDQMRGDLQEYGGGLRGHLRVFANTTAVTDFLPEILPEFLADNPKVNIDLQEKPNADIARGVQDGRADIGIVAGQVDTLGLQSLHFSTDRLVLATAKNHPLAQRQKVAFVDTLDEDAVGMHHGSTLQTFLSQVTERLGKPLKLRIQLSSFDAMCRMIGAGVGVGIVPESAAKRNQEAMNLALVELSDAWSVRERYILTRDQTALPGYAQSLIALLCAHYARADKDSHAPASPA
jgi:DNA-binding transcriptional LysR family regulator